MGGELGKGEGGGQGTLKWRRGIIKMRIVNVASIAVEAAARLDDAALRQLRAEEDGLRRLAFESDAKASREHLIDALADSLSAAMLTRAKIASGGENTEALNRAEAVVRKLTAAINDEVRSLDT